MEAYVVSINTAGQAAYRRFWSGPVGTAILTVPGLAVAIAGVFLGLRATGGVQVFFAVVIVVSGLYGSYAGWDHRSRALRPTADPPLAFALEADGVVFPRDKRYGWPEVRFVLTDEERPRILCTPVGVAYAVERLDREPAEIDAALAQMSSGRSRLERV